MTKPIRYVLDKPWEYFVYNLRERTFVPVKGYPIKAEWANGLDLFVHRRVDLTKFWRVSEGKTGGGFSGYERTRYDAIAEAKKQTEEQSHVGINISVASTVRKFGLSPRYRKEGGK
jgi:hypothetical protein